MSRMGRHKKLSMERWRQQREAIKKYKSMVDKNKIMAKSCIGLAGLNLYLLGMITGLIV